MSGLSFDRTLSKSLDDCIFQGKNYRITVLTERLVRLEYSTSGNFVDDPTEQVWFRKFDKPKFEVDDKDTTLVIKTDYFHLNYKKEKSFMGSKFVPAANLRISLKGTNTTWYYKHPEVRNILAGAYSDGDKLYNQKSLWSFDGMVSIDDSYSMLFDENGDLVPRSEYNVDIYVFMYGKDYELALRDYYNLTGWPLMLPRYAFGVWFYKNAPYSSSEFLKIVSKFDDFKIPLSVLILSGWNVRNSLKFDQDKYNDPLQFIELMHYHKIHVGLKLNPIKDGVIDYKQYLSDISDLKRHGMDLAYIDYFERQKLKELMHLKHYTYYYNYGVDNKRSLILANNNAFASHRYPVMYAGDNSSSWESLRKMAVVNVSNYGLGLSYIASAVGGFANGMESKELLTRFVQLGVFSPILMLASDESKYYVREPWKLGVKTSNIITDYLRLRQKLIPYIYSEMYKYHSTGKPIIVPIYKDYMEYYDDDNYNCEYHFGSEIFISPILKQKDFILNRVIHKKVLPKGTWYNFETGNLVPGGKKYVSFYRDEDYPIYVKAGGIIPFNADVDIEPNAFNVPKCLEIHIFPGADNSYSLYEDDGINNDYLNGKYIISNIEYRYRTDNYAVTVRPVKGKKGIIADSRDYKFVFRNTRFANEVKAYVNGKAIEYSSYVVSNDFIVEVKNVSTTDQLIIECFGNNIQLDSGQVINDDIVRVISDLPISTDLKNQIDKILFSSDSIKLKRIKIREIKHLDRKYVQLFIKLLEYLNEI